MAKDITSKIPDLISTGENFTFDNFAAKGARGYVDAPSAEWLIWCHHADQVRAKLGKSPAGASISRGLGSELVGYGSDTFQKAHRSILSGLKAALVILATDSEDGVPASDRIVSLSDNEAVRGDVIDQLDKLIGAVQESNDFPGTSEEKGQIVAELSAGRRLLEAVRVRSAAIAATLMPAVKFVMEKGGGTLVTNAATALWNLLKTIF